MVHGQHTEPKISQNHSSRPFTVDYETRRTKVLQWATDSGLVKARDTRYLHWETCSEAVLYWGLPHDCARSVVHRNQCTWFQLFWRSTDHLCSPPGLISSKHARRKSLTDWSSIFPDLLVSSVDIGATGDYAPNNSIKVLPAAKNLSLLSFLELVSRRVIGSHNSVTSSGS
jgi:hypothetical protein